MKKVIKLGNSKFVAKITSLNVVTCTHVKDAYDVSEVPFTVLSDVVNRLRELGQNVSIVEVKK